MAPVLAPVRVATMLVASVVPSTMVLVAARSSGSASPTCAASREMHSTTPDLGVGGSAVGLGRPHLVGVAEKDAVGEGAAAVDGDAVVWWSSGVPHRLREGDELIGAQAHGSRERRPVELGPARRSPDRPRRSRGRRSPRPPPLSAQGKTLLSQSSEWSMRARSAT